MKEKKNIEKVPEEVIKVLSGDVSEEERRLLSPDVKKIEDEKQGKFYSSIIYYLTGLEFDEEEAKHYWGEILKHKYFMSEKMGRNVGVRVAALDYFMNVKKMLEAVTFVDVNKFSELDIQAKYDKLTRLYNRRALDDIFQEIIEKAKSSDFPVSLSMVDIDNFKQFNDNYGHLAGDTLLYEVAKILKEVSKNNSGYAFRYGGEEFLLIFPEKNKEECFKICDEMRRKIESLQFFEFKNITISCGISEYPSEGEKLEDLIKVADNRLYKAKREGKNRVIFQ